MRPMLHTLAAALFFADLLAAPLDAAVRRTRLSAEGQSWSEVQSTIKMTPDAERVLYLHDAVTDDAFELWGVRRDGSDRVRLSYPLPSGRTVGQFEPSLDGRHALYLAAQQTTKVQLWRVPIEGPGAAAELLGPTSAAGDVDVLEFWLATGGRIVYMTHDGGLVSRVWSVPEEGPAEAAIEISPPPPPNNHYHLFGFTAMTPDRTRFVWSVYRGSLQDAQPEIWSLPVAGPAGDAERLSPAVTASADFEFDFVISPDSSRIVYRADLEVANRQELWGVPINGRGESPERLNPTPVPNGDVSSMSISADSSTVLFVGDVATDQRVELWSVPIDGPWQDSIKLNPPPPTGGGVWSSYGIGLSPPGAPTRAVFAGDLDVDGRVELWSGSVDGPEGSAIAISGSVPAGGGGVSSFAIADAQRVAFRGDLSRAGQDWLYSRALDGSGGRLTLTDLTALPDAVLFHEQVSPDGRFVAYKYQSSVGATVTLRRVPVAGGANETLTPGFWPVFTDVDSFRIADDSRGVLFRADTSFDGALALWMADEWIFAANFEEGDTSEWTSAVP